MNILVFGASITQGAFDGEGGGWVNRLASYCFERSELSIDDSKEIYTFNLGISGDRVSDIAARFAQESSARSDGAGDLVLFSIGINGSKINRETGMHGTELEEYKEGLRSLIKQARMNDFSVICVGLTGVDESKVDPIPWNTPYSYLNTEVKKYTYAIDLIAQEEGVDYIPLLDIFDGHPELITDGVHPNAKGHQLIFERVKECLEKAGII